MKTAVEKGKDFVNDMLDNHSEDEASAVIAAMYVAWHAVMSNKELAKQRVIMSTKKIVALIDD